MTGPGDETAAAAVGAGRLRASRAEREQVIEILKGAFVQDRLTKDELDERVGQAFTAQTYGDLAALTADLPAGPAPGSPAAPASPSRGAAVPQPRLPVSAEVRTGLRVIFVVTVFTALLWAVAVFTYSGAAFIAAFGATATAIVVAALTGTRLLGRWLDKRSGEPLPPGLAP